MGIKIYGITSCDSVKKAIKFLKTNDIAYEFVDFKKEAVNSDKINQWLKKVPLSQLLNTKGKDL